MKKFSAAVCLTISIHTCFAQSNPIFRMKVGPPSPAPPLVREAGDDVKLDPGSGDIVVNSRGTKFRIPKTNQLDMSWNCVLSRRSGTFEYACTLASGKATFGNVTFFTMACDSSDKVNVRTPGNWKRMGGPLFLQNPMQFLLIARDDAMSQLLRPGTKTGIFQFESELMAGMVAFDVLAPPRFAAPGEESLGERLSRVSRWANEEILKLDTQDRHVRRFFALGPKIEAALDSYAPIRSDISIALTMPDYAPWKQELSALSKATNSDLLPALQRLKNDSPPLKALRQALLWRLDSLAK